jgi:hypothetical protein
VLAGGELSASLPAALTSGKGHRYPLDRRVCGPQSWSGHSSGRDRNPVVQLVAYSGSFKFYYSVTKKIFIFFYIEQVRYVAYMIVASM